MIAHLIAVGLIELGAAVVPTLPAGSGGGSGRGALPEVAARHYPVREPQASRIADELQEIAAEVKTAAPAALPALTAKYTELLMARMQEDQRIDAALRAEAQAQLLELQAQMQANAVWQALMQDDETVAINVACLLLR